MTTLPSDLALRLEKIFTPEENKSLKSVFSLEKRPTTFRINTLKWNNEEVEQELIKNNITFQKLSFPENCYLLDDNFSESDLWKLICYTTGRIYIQGISSQIPPHIFTNTTPQKILDATAAPGWKTSQLSALYPDAEIYAFEPSKIRYDKMCHNLKKLWCSNVETIYDSIENIGNYIGVTVSSWVETEGSSEVSSLNAQDMDSSSLRSSERHNTKEYFDMVLVDAPCSSEWSLLCNNTKFLENWDISHIKKNYKRQKRICDSIVPYIKTGWEFVYSTCTLAPEENEAVIHYLLCNYPELELSPMDIPVSPEIITKAPLINFEKNSYKKEISEKCIRIIPSEHTEWFFLAKTTKKEA